ncbi:protein MAINTENANCE OF MERISTEMS-like [Vigna umbellata]|uniref:protein MAINTENANCE OF MERISTEMS-like n=1 Tax=Vigna umbellata TaxID=87088 RepID=UPI001F5F3791|nr:protein MAINTENANCE OF MERISTEMS-like [Vigna umbellata]
MARTRGGSSSHRGESSSQGERRRPIASARRRRGAVESDIHVEDHGDVRFHEDAVEDHEDVAEGGFPGGPLNSSVLTHYIHHVAYAIWQGRERQEIKLISHGKKLNRLGSCHEGIRDIVNGSGLMSLVGMSYDYVDRGLLLAFVERFHFETCSFHLPVGEMTLTLNDVSSLLHLPVLGQLCHLEEVDFEDSRCGIVELLGVDGGRASAELTAAHGVKVRLSWLRDIYAEHCEQQQWEYAARAYLLHLVGCNIFADKTATSIRVSYLLLFRDVHICGRYAWGVAALVYMYDQLGDASLASTRQMAGYLTLLQSWIYEHFPTLGRRRMVSSYMEDRPRAAKWESPRQGSTLLEVRVHLDALTYDLVIWYPYESHRESRPFYGVCMFSGWIRIGETLCRHLPERVLRQFGFQQSIPRDPPVVANADILVTDDVWLHYRDHVVRGVSVSRFPSDCVDGYLAWFRIISHPYIIPADDDRPSLAPRLRRDIPDEVPQHRRSASQSGVVRTFGKRLQQMLYCREIPEGTIGYTHARELLDLADAVVKEYSPTRIAARNVRDRHIRGRRSTSN